VKDQIVAEFDLREEQPMLATRLFALCLSEKWSEGATRTLLQNMTIPVLMSH
jgi:hypothetical protein